MKNLIAAIFIALTAISATAQQAAESDLARLSQKVPEIRFNQAAAAIAVAKATGKFSTDRKEPEYIRNGERNMSGKLNKAAAYDGATVGVGQQRTAEEQRFLEINQLVASIPPPRQSKQIVAIDSRARAVSLVDRLFFRNRIRYVAKALGEDISASEQVWATEDLKTETEKNMAEIQAIKNELRRQQADRNQLENDLRRARGN